MSPTQGRDGKARRCGGLLGYRTGLVQLCGYPGNCYRGRVIVGAEEGTTKDTKDTKKMEGMEEVKDMNGM